MSNVQISQFIIERDAANVNHDLKKLVRERASQTGDSIYAVEDLDSDPKHVKVRFYGADDDIVSIRFKIQGLEKLKSFRILLSGDANITYVLWNVYCSPQKRSGITVHFVVKQTCGMRFVAIWQRTL